MTTLQIFSKPIVVAHRGASERAPENTMPAFELAWKAGAHAIEADFHLTKDNRIICMHDSNLKRTTNTDKEVRQMTLDEIRQLDAGIWFHEKFRDTKVPTLVEILDVLPEDKKIFIEVKCGEEILPHLSRVLSNSNVNYEQVVFKSFSLDLVQSFKKQFPGITTLLLIDLRDSDYFKQSFPKAKDLIAFLKKLNIDGLSCKDHSSITADYIKEIFEAEFELHFWTIDDSKVAKRYTKSRAASIITNAPKRIVKLLK